MIRLLQSALAGEPASAGRKNDLAVAHLLRASLDGKTKTVLQVTATLGLLASAAWPSAGLGPAANALVVAAAALTLLSGVRLVLRARQTTAHPA